MKQCSRFCSRVKSCLCIFCTFICLHLHICHMSHSQEAHSCYFSSLGLNLRVCILCTYLCLWYPDSFLGRDEQFSGCVESPPCPAESCIQGCLLMSRFAIVPSSRMKSLVTIIMSWRTEINLISFKLNISRLLFCHLDKIMMISSPKILMSRILN